MEIIPAVIIKDGKCIHPYQDNYNRETILSDDPIEIALKWQSLGASRLHIVDLDGAATGEPCNLDIVKDIVNTVLIPTQLGGGLRQLEMIEHVLKAGIERVIFSTAAIEEPELVEVACRKFSESIIVSIDFSEGSVATHGWRQITELSAVEFIRSMVRLGVKRFICTDISRNGTLTEPNFTAIAELIDAVKLPVIIAGGVSSLIHLKMLARLGAEGIIIGKALYTKRINLKDAVAAISQIA